MSPFEHPQNNSLWKNVSLGDSWHVSYFSIMFCKFKYSPSMQSLVRVLPASGHVLLDASLLCESAWCAERVNRTKDVFCLQTFQRHTPGLKEEEQSCFCWFFCLCFSSPLRTSLWSFSPKILLIGMANRLSLVTGGKLTGDPTPVWKTLALSVTLWPSCICFGKLPSPLAGLTV